MLKTRLITAFTLAFIVIYILSFAPQAWCYALLVVLASTCVFIAGAEFAALAWHLNMPVIQRSHKLHPLLTKEHKTVGVIYGFLVLLAGRFETFDVKKSFLYEVTWILISFVLVSSYLCFTYKDLKSACGKIFIFLSGFLYLSLPGICLLRLSLLPLPEHVPRSAPVYFTLACVSMGDVGAYFIGTKFGKRKIITHISPKKSLEGFFGGLATSAICALVLNNVFHLPFTPFVAALYGALLCITGQAGDLLESVLKRASGFKDSGSLLPGHGGMLDRLDSLTLTIPLGYVLFALSLNAL